MNTNTWLYPFPGLHQRQIEEHLALQNDSRTWTTKDGYKPFPAPLNKKTP